MPHMMPVVEEGEWYEIDGPAGTEYVPAELATIDVPANLDEMSAEEQERFITETVVPTLRDYMTNSKVWSFKKLHGFGARLSAPGFMDQTEWSVFEFDPEDEASKDRAENEAKSHLTDNYGVCTECGEDLNSEGDCDVCEPEDDDARDESDEDNSDDDSDDDDFEGDEDITED